MVTFHLKIISIKSFSPVILLSLTLNCGLRFEISKEMSVILVYWLAAWEKNSTFRQKDSDSIYSDFSLKENELTPSFQ